MKFWRSVSVSSHPVLLPLSACCLPCPRGSPWHHASVCALHVQAWPWPGSRSYNLLHLHTRIPKPGPAVTSSGIALWGQSTQGSLCPVWCSQLSRTALVPLLTAPLLMKGLDGHIPANEEVNRISQCYKCNIIYIIGNTSHQTSRCKAAAVNLSGYSRTIYMPQGQIVFEQQHRRTNFLLPSVHVNHAFSERL